MLSDCQDWIKDGKISQCFRDDVLGTDLPAVITCLIIFFDVVKCMRLPTAVIQLGQFLSLPFQNFICPADLVRMKQNCKEARVSSWQLVFLLLISTLETLVSLFHTTYTTITLGYTPGATIIGLLSWIIISTKIYFHPPKTPPYLILWFCFVQASSSVLDLVYDVHHEATRDVVRILTFIASSALIGVIGTLPIRLTLPGTCVACPNDPPSNRITCPEDSVNLWQWCTFSFVEPIFKVAISRRIEETDVWSLSPYFKHNLIFQKCLEYLRSHPTHSVLRFLLISNSLDLILDVILELWSAVIGFVPPYALQRILSALQEETERSKSEAFLFAFIAFLANLSFAQVDLFQGWHSRRCYERTRGQLFCLLHYKALKRRDISGKASMDGESDNADLGKVVNLMHGDAYAVSHRFWEFSILFASTVRLVIALVFLYRVLGWSAMAGVAVVLLAYALNYPLAKYHIYITRESWKAKDMRMNRVNEFFQNIRFLKYYGWENFWKEKVNKHREAELKWRVKENIVSTCISFIWTWVPSATALFSFLCYTLIARQPLTISKAFTSLALFSQLQGPMASVPDQFFALLHALVSMQRIEKFLVEEEVPSWASSLKGVGIAEKSMDVGFVKASFRWYSDTSSSLLPARFTLGPLDIVFPPGKLSLVTGVTGAGKTALLAALLGEMECLEGQVLINKHNHNVAYCAQNPWLEHATIRENIIFHSEIGFDKARYQAVIQACALERDLTIFDAGDLTEIGEKGVTLSGGQRARIALARALYSKATCLLLDDPLAAVDMHTAAHLVHCLSGPLLKDRTVILVSHHVKLCLPITSFLLEVEGGHVVHQGLISDLRSLGILDRIIKSEDLQEQEGTHHMTTQITQQENEQETFLDQPVDLTHESPNGKLVEVESRAEGRVSVHTYMTYIRAAGVLLWGLTIFFILLIRVINVGNDLFLAKWGEAYEQMVNNIYQLTSELHRNYTYMPLPPPDIDPRPWLLVYLLISLAGAFSVLLYISLGYYASLRASRRLFIAMLARLTRAPTRFYDVTPIGRILNRFTADINTIDSALQQSARAALTGIFTFAASFLFIVWIVPQFTPFAIFIAWLYVRLAPSYIQASRDLRRLESISLSPAFAGFDELLKGLTHVRAFAMEQKYQDRFYQRVDTFQGYDHVYWLVSGWLRWRYDCLGSVVVYLSTLFALLYGVSSGFTAIIIVQAGIFAEASRQLVRVSAQLELDFNSVERLGEYLLVPQEASSIIQDSRPPAYWPSADGGLIVEDLSVSYAQNLPAVLDGLSFIVKPREKVAVVGRTGSGKSTLALSLLRIIEPRAGKIVLDGIDITKIGLEDLRTRITLISQDVSLFSGTIRANLDPLHEHSDYECWEVLRRCHLSGDDGSRSGIFKTLEDPVSSSGSFSAGERQLVALARAILRGTQVVIMDEATSQIDVQLDDQIQKTIRTELSNAMVITIAHRLKTIIDYDRVMVLGPNGHIIEFDEPQKLLSTKGSAFRDMCARSADWNDLNRNIKLEENE